ncbi:MAG: hypothetical protein R2873_36825, partial [Caldilineaceae bacterium]
MIMLKNTTGRRKRCAGRALSILLSIAILLAGCANPKIAPPVNSAADSTRIVDPPFASADSVRVQEGIPRVECYMHQEQAFCVSNENVMTHRDPAMAGYFADLAATQDVALHCGADTFYFPFNRIDSAEFAAAFLPGGGTDTGLPGHTTGDSGGGDAFFADLTIPAFQNDCPTANQLFYEDRNGEMQFHIPGGGAEEIARIRGFIDALANISTETESAIGDMEKRIAVSCEEMRGDYHPETSVALAFYLTWQFWVAVTTIGVGLGTTAYVEHNKHDDSVMIGDELTPYA